MPRDLVCFSHLRWDFVYQRPNHLMARAARDRRVFFVEEPAFVGDAAPFMKVVEREGVVVATPRLPTGLSGAEVTRTLAGLVDRFAGDHRIRRPVSWYCTPMSLPWTRHLDVAATVYDSMDYLAGFRGAPPELLGLEVELLERADLVFSGGASLHERMRRRHPASHCFPSSVDVGHFRSARTSPVEPADQASIEGPRIGFAGVIDERIDVELIDGVAGAHPEWHIVLVGPVVKIAEADVPTRANIHRLGMKSYAELPAYLGGWSVGWMPFARNDATRYISPTKTPEYLAAGLPVVSTSIRDVIEPYGSAGLVAIADSVADTASALEQAMAGRVPDRGRVDTFLASRSWDRTWAAMATLVDQLEAPVAPNRGFGERRRPSVERRPAAVPVGGPERAGGATGSGGALDSLGSVASAVARLDATVSPSSAGGDAFSSTTHLTAGRAGRAG